jgi:hypothetical protein
MRLPSIDIAIGRALGLSRFTLSRLRSNTKAKTLLLHLEPQHKALKAAQAAVNGTSDDELDARGPVLEVDAAAAEVLTEFQLDVLKAVAKNYQAPLYIALFPKGLSEFRKLKGADLAAAIATMTQTLEAEGKTSPLAGYVAKFTALSKQWAAPVAAYKKAVDAEVQANIVAGKARHEWRMAYEAVYGLLRAMFPGRKAYVESFFLKVDAPAKPKKVATPV